MRRSKTSLLKLPITVMKRTYLFNTVAWNYGKKIGFPVCKKNARASPIPHHTWMKSGTLVSPPNLYPSWGWQFVGVRLRRARYFCTSSLPMRPRARLNLTPNLVSPLKDINRDWVRVCHTPLGERSGAKMAALTCTQILLAIGMLISGSINTLSKKAQNDCS